MDGRERFIRTDQTLAAYLLLGYFAYLQAILGPLMPSLRRDLHLSYAAGGLHFSAFAGGMVVAGLAGDRALAWLGRRVTLWGGAVGMAAGAGGLAAAHHLALTVASAGVMGLCGTLLLVTIQAVLAEEHGRRRAQALTEANVVASLGAALAALAVGLALSIGVGWRTPLLLAAAVLGLIGLRYRRARPAEPAPKTPWAGSGLRLPRLFWVYWSAIVLGVAAEWCTAYWATDYLRQVGGFTPAVAATVTGAYLGVAIFARVIGSRAARTVPSGTLLVLSASTALVGALVFWREPGGPVMLAGLGVAGLGIANLFPLGLATNLGLAPGSPDAASARMSLAGGLAILTAPLALGALADHTGLRAAYAVVPVMLGLAGILALGAGMAARRGRGTAPLTLIGP